MKSMRIYSAVAEVQTGFTKAWFSAANVMALGYLSPIAPMIERTCDLATGMVNEAETAFRALSPQTDLDVKELRGIIERHEPELKKPMSAQELDMISRTQPDYSNLRRAANGDDLRTRSILDDDALWIGQGAMAKSAHKYDAGMGRERRIMEQAESA